MPREILNNGSIANDGTGDSLRDAIGKINNNFAEIYNKVGGTDSGDYLSPNVKFDSNNVIFGSTNELSLGAATLTGNRTITLPDISGTLLTDQNNQTIRNPILVGDIYDSNQNELLSFVSGNISAVNKVQIKSSATGSPVVISSTGDDSDINLNLETKGEGEVNINAGLVLSTGPFITSSGALDITKPLIVFNSSTAISQFHLILDSFQLCKREHQIQFLDLFLLVLLQ